jgi:tetratricopeptide (TPR) repeat protein
LLLNRFDDRRERRDGCLVGCSRHVNHGKGWCVVSGSESVPGPGSGVGLRAYAQDEGRAYQVGQGSQYITEHYYYQAPAREGTAAPVVLPVVADDEQPSGFVGRENEVATLLGLLDPSRSNPGPVTISGLPGVGKTALAWQVARAAVGRGWFAGGAMFVDLHGFDPQARIEPALVFAPMLHALGVASSDVPSTVAEQATTYHLVLAALAQQQRPVLLVLDNASEPGQIAPLLPTGRTHRVLVTSHRSLGALPGAYLVEVDVLDPSQAVALLDAALQRHSPGDRRLRDDRERAAALAALCGYLPLALQIVAALLGEEPGRPVAELVAELAEVGARLEALAYEEVTVRAAFDLSYRDLPEDHARLFRLLSAAPGPDVSTEVAAVVADQPASRVRRGLAGLARAHLIQHGTTTNRWQMHRLIQLYATEQAELHAEQDQRDTAITRVLDHYLTTIQGAIPPDDCPLPALTGAETVDRFTDQDQARAWLQAERPNLVAATALAAATSHPEIATRLSSTLCEFLFRYRYLDDWLSTAEIGVRAARELGDRRCEGEMLTRLGAALRDVGRVEEAIPSLKHAVAIFRASSDRSHEATALGTLSLALRQAGRVEEAITTLQQTITIFRELDQRDDRLESMALDILGLTLHQAGRIEEAITSLQQAVTIYRATDDWYGEGITLANLGLALHKVGRVDEAITTLEQAVTIYHERYDQHSGAIAVEGLGVSLQWVRRADEAIPSLKQAAAIFRGIGDQYHQAIALDILGLALRRTHRFDEAITTLEQAVTIYHDINEQRYEGTALTNLSITLAEVGRFEEVQDYAARALKLFVAVQADEDAVWARNLMERLTKTSPPTASPPPARRWPLSPLRPHRTPSTTV